MSPNFSVILDNLDQSFALIHRQGQPTVDILQGDVLTVESLAAIPLDGREVVAMVPFRQVKERGFEAIDDGAPLLCLQVSHSESPALEDILSQLPSQIPAVDDRGFDVPDDEYAAMVQRVISEEIGRGEGANFVIRRDYRAHTDVAPRTAALAWFRELLLKESGAYWTFAFITPQVIAVGASPERHVSAVNGTVLMNPISGTLRHGGKRPDVDTLLTFLADRKESEELVMVVDEELKMMSAVCPNGGLMRGPYLKPMSQLTHTEYLLEGKSDLDPREILRLTMFAPTVTGSPMGNACRVIARHEKTGRGYYSGVLARFEPTENGYDLDAPILIRTAVIDAQGDITISAGATLVRHSDPISETAETRAKASGVLAALGLMERPPVPTTKAPTDDPRVLQALADRNLHLAPFWRDAQQELSTFDATALVIDCDDDFTAMLAHQLRRLGMQVSIRSWKDLGEDPTEDLVIFGPGPGDPLRLEDPRIAKVRQLLTNRLDAGLPTIAVCLSHQMLSSLAGLPIVELPEPRQGMPLEVEVLGDEVRIGYYNTFSAVAPNGSETPKWGLRVHSEPGTGFVHSLIGPRVASVQGHLESVLSTDGFATLAALVAHVLDSND